MYKKLIISIFLLCIPAQAFELDTSVDDEIRKNYNPSAIEKSLPSLPKTTPSQNQTNSQQSTVKNLPKIESTVTKIPLNYIPVDKSLAIRIKKGTKISAKSGAYLSDNTREGAQIKFITTKPIYQRYITIPVGTTFYAVVTDSHNPQISGNGGLLEIQITGISYKGNLYRANGKITKANYKKVFFNNIKGKHQYWKGVSRQVDKGDRFYKKTKRASNKLANNPIGMFISPLPVIVGTGVYAVNLVASPISSIGSKGGKISIPAGSEFEFKLLDDIYLQ